MFFIRLCSIGRQQGLCMEKLVLPARLLSAYLWFIALFIHNPFLRRWLQWNRSLYCKWVNCLHTFNLPIDKLGFEIKINFIDICIHYGYYATSGPNNRTDYFSVLYNLLDTCFFDIIPSNKVERKLKTEKPKKNKLKYSIKTDLCIYNPQFNLFP